MDDNRPPELKWILTEIFDSILIKMSVTASFKYTFLIVKIVVIRITIKSYMPNLEQNILENIFQAIVWTAA